VPVTIARFKDLCVDATDASSIATFWHEVLGGLLVARPNGVHRLEVSSEPVDEVLWINAVPEPRRGTTRVHLDLRLPTPDPAPLLAAGASIVCEPGADPRWVLTDPEGNEFCAFPPAGVDQPKTAAFELVVDCRDAPAQAAWWTGITGGTVEIEGDGASITGTAGFPWRYWVFDPVSEAKVVKNRVHWDIQLAGPDPGPLIEAGARVLREPDGVNEWWVMADPEDNEFCAFPAAVGAT
jgi:hypothetical protein